MPESVLRILVCLSLSTCLVAGCSNGSGSNAVTMDTVDAADPAETDAGTEEETPEEQTAPLPLTDDLCEDPANMDVILASPASSELLLNAGVSGEDLNVGQVERMIDEPTRGPFYNFNFIRFRERAVYPDGRDTDLTGREANDLYNPIEFLDAIGARVVFVMDVDQQIEGGEPVWENIAVVEYPCPIALFAMTVDPAFQERSVNKDAGVESTWVFVSYLEPSQLPADLEVADGPFPSTSADPAFELVHLRRYGDEAQYEAGAEEPARSGEAAWDLFAEGRDTAATNVGSLPTARFVVDGTLIGNTEDWDAIDIDYMPSQAAYQALLEDDNRQAVLYHREAALAGSYSVTGSPAINVIPGAPDVGSAGEPLPITELGVGTVCLSDADCEGIGTCLSDGVTAGFCTRMCGAGECGSPYQCCSSCAELVAAQLPFSESACVPAQFAAQLTTAPASCTCE
ncbi:MAG: hypothetical protein AAGI24_08485 [Pseudomonadota bacterium]